MKNAQRSILMKTTFSYNIKKVLAGTMLVALPFAFGGCEKDNNEPNNPSNPDTPQQRTEEFIYNANMEFYRNANSAHISHTAFIDTAAKYANDEGVKQVHITPDNPGMLETLPGNNVQTRAEFLENVYNASNQKLSGENTTLYLDPSALSNQTVQQVLHNKLKIALLQR